MLIRNNFENFEVFLRLVRQRLFVHSDKRYLYRSKGEAFKLKNRCVLYNHSTLEKGTLQEINKL